MSTKQMNTTVDQQAYSDRKTPTNGFAFNCKDADDVVVARIDAKVDIARLEFCALVEAQVDFISLS